VPRFGRGSLQVEIPPEEKKRVERFEPEGKNEFFRDFVKRRGKYGTFVVMSEFEDRRYPIILSIPPVIENAGEELMNCRLLQTQMIEFGHKVDQTEYRTLEWSKDELQKRILEIMAELEKIQEGLRRRMVIEGNSEEAERFRKDSFTSKIGNIWEFMKEGGVSALPAAMQQFTLDDAMTGGIITGSLLVTAMAIGFTVNALAKKHYKKTRESNKKTRKFYNNRSLTSNENNGNVSPRRSSFWSFRIGFG